MRQKGFAPTLLLTFIIVLGLLFYFVANSKSTQNNESFVTPNSTIYPNTNSSPSSSIDTRVKESAPKEYTDQIYGFSFTYPGNMTKEDSNEKNIFYLTTAEYNRSGISGSGYQIQITILDTDIPSVEKYQKLVPNTPESSFLLKQEVLIINSYPTVVRTYKDGQSIYKKYYVYSKNLALLFQGTGRDHSTLDQIISTFKFSK